MGERLEALLGELIQSHPDRIEGVRGWGLLRGVVLREGGPSAPQVVQAAMDEGLLLVPAGPRVVRIVPPLVIRPRHLRRLVKRLGRALERVG
jgi:acetylornithine aminotransferase